MKKSTGVILLLLLAASLQAQQTRFENSTGNETATYFEAIEWYKNLAGKYAEITVKEMGLSDAGYPLHLVLLSKDKTFEPALWQQNHKAVFFILNGIHPGEPDGIDASMMMARDLLQKKLPWPDNIVMAIIPVYNIELQTLPKSNDRTGNCGIFRIGQDIPDKGLINLQLIKWQTLQVRE